MLTSGRPFAAQGGLGAGGSGLTTLMQTAASTSPDGKSSTAWWGRDVLGYPVTNQAQFNAAVALLRTDDGRSLGGDLTYSPPTEWVYAPAWNTARERSCLGYCACAPLTPCAARTW